MRLSNRVAVVTGASSGIGRATAIALAEDGARVVVADLQEESRDGEQPSTTEAIAQHGGETAFVRCDVSRSADVTALFAVARERFRGVDILVNNAGVFVRNALTDVSEDEWDRVLSVNLKGYYLTARLAIPIMLERGGGGAIVNVGSIHGLLGTGMAASYCASKGGVDNLTRQLAVDYAPRGIRVNSVAPGTIETAMSKPFRDDPDMLAEYRRRTLLPRLGMPRDVANAVVFLASDEASFITGHTLVVDGGWTAA
jgi:glucose 1-dehydrogenase